MSLWFWYVLLHKHYYVTLISMRIGAQTSLCHFDFGAYCYTNVTMSLLFRYVLLHKRYCATLISICIATQTSLCHSDFDTHCYTNITMSLWFRYVLLHKRHYVTLISTWLLHKRHYVSLISAHIAAQTSLCHSDVRPYNCTDVIMSLWFRYAYCNTSVIMPLWFQYVLLHKVRCVALILVRILLHLRHYVTDSVRNCYTHVCMSLIQYVIVTQTSLCHWSSTYRYASFIMPLWFQYVLLHKVRCVTLILVRILLHLRHYVTDSVRNCYTHVFMSLIQYVIVTQTALCHWSSTYRYASFIMSLIKYV